MNENWIDFLKSHGATVTPTLDVTFPNSQASVTPSITPITHLTLLKVTGGDAAQFLQGQLTCNINDLTGTNSFFAAFCSAKGRVISTLLIFKQDDSYLVILPNELVNKVTKKLQMYIMRSDVQITNISHDYCLIGLTTEDANLLPSLPNTQFAVSQSAIKLPSNTHRYLMFYTQEDACTQWDTLINNHQATPVNSDNALYQDISSGLPWLTQASSEEHIPQMLNIDKLGGISFNKGCYTGQEIVARTHYLGKAKRQLFIAECLGSIEADSQIINSDNEQTVGKIISFQSIGETTRMLVVMPNEGVDLDHLIINNPAKNKVTVTG